MNKQPIDLSSVWRKYKVNGDLDAREKIIEYYIDLVQYIAGRIAIHLPQNVDSQDLLSYGAFGLIDAIDKYDIEREVKFETYASTRIRGAIIDGLRSTDWIPRSVRSRARQIEREITQLENTHGRTPTEAEVAAALDVSLNKYREMVKDISSSSLLSLDEAVIADGNIESIKLIDTIVDRVASIDQDLLANESKEELAVAIDTLSERERMVISLYYHEGLTLKEIGSILEVSESRICQIHSKALSSLRSHLSLANM